MGKQTPEWLVQSFRIADPVLDDGPLAGIEQIPWSALHHAHGTADDVPSLLRALVSANDDQRMFAAQLLHETIWHQGTIFEATLPSIQFLFALLQDPKTPDQALIAFLLASLATGSTGWHLNITNNNHIKSYRKLFAQYAPSLIRMIQKQWLIERSVKTAIGSQLMLIYPFLTHPDEAIPSTIAQTLANYPTQAPIFIPLLYDALIVEESQYVRDAINQALVRLTS